MDMLLKSLLEFGLGAVFAGVMVGVYLNTVKQMRQDRKFMEDRLTGLINDYNKACNATTNTLLETTKILSELYTWLKARNGNH